jgi:hypothetical protein
MLEWEIVLLFSTDGYSFGNNESNGLVVLPSIFNYFLFFYSFECSNVKWFCCPRPKSWTVSYRNMNAEMRIQGITLKFLLAQKASSLLTVSSIYTASSYNWWTKVLSSTLDSKNIPILTRASQSFFVTLSQSQIGCLGITRSKRRSREVIRL